MAVGTRIVSMIGLTIMAVTAVAWSAPAQAASVDSSCSFTVRIPAGASAAVLAEFARNGCTGISDRTDRARTCQVFGEEWPFVFGSKAPRPGTVQMFAFQPL